MAKHVDKHNLDLFLSLARSGIWGIEEPVSSPDADWNVISQWARQQTIIPIIAEGIRISASSSLDSVEDLMYSASSNSRIHHLLDNTAAKIYTVLEDDGIPSVLIKGQGIARYYRDPQLRQCGDVDLLVGSKNYDKLLPVLSRHGYTVEKCGSKHLDFYISDVRIELHRTCVETSSPEINAFFRQWGDRQTESSEKSFSPAGSEVMIRIPDDEFNAMFVFFHMFSSLIENGTGLRQLCDLAAVLKTSRATLDREIVLKTLTSHRMLHAWQMFGCILVDMLGLPVEAFPFYDETCRPQAERLFRMIIRGGNFGFFRKRPAGRQTLWTSLNYFWQKVRWKASLLKLFPESLRNFYLKSFIRK